VVLEAPDIVGIAVLDEIIAQVPSRVAATTIVGNAAVGAITERVVVNDIGHRAGPVTGKDGKAEIVGDVVPDSDRSRCAVRTALLDRPAAWIGRACIAENAAFYVYLAIAARIRNPGTGSVLIGGLSL